MMTLSLAFSLRLSSVTSTTAVAPAGITAPFDPVTALVKLALKRSPTWLVLVQTLEPAARLRVAPAGIVPTFAAVPALLRVTVLPLDVTEVVGLRVVVVGVLVAVVFVVVVLVVVVVVVLGAGLAAVPAGTSVSAGCALVSRFAS